MTTCKQNGGASRKNVTMKNRDDMSCYDATYHSINHWYKSMYEKLGWMILAKNHGMVDKVVAYKNSLERLRCAIEKKMKKTRDHDKKDDLKIMHTDLLVLIEHAMKDL
jgi:hypothetical protein